MSKRGFSNITELNWLVKYCMTVILKAAASLFIGPPFDLFLSLAIYFYLSSLHLGYRWRHRTAKSEDLTKMGFLRCPGSSRVSLGRKSKCFTRFRLTLWVFRLQMSTSGFSRDAKESIESTVTTTICFNFRFLKLKPNIANICTSPNIEICFPSAISSLCSSASRKTRRLSSRCHHQMGKWMDGKLPKSLSPFCQFLACCRRLIERGNTGKDNAERQSPKGTVITVALRGLPRGESQICSNPQSVRR